MVEFKYKQMKTIETDKYILRPVRLEDAKDMFEYYRQEKVVKYLPLKPHKNINDTKAFINNFFIKNYQKGKVGQLAIYSKKDKKVIGNVGLNNVNVNAKQGEIGICINPKYWGDDLSTELTKYSLMYGFEILNMEKLIAITYGENKYTPKSLLYLGFKYKKSYNKKVKNSLLGKSISHHRYELLRSDYFKNKQLGKYN